MKFSIWSSYYIDLSPEDAVLEFEKNGVRYSELSDEHGYALLSRGNSAEKTGESFRRFAEDHGLTFPQGHLWLKCRLCENGAVDILKSWLDLYMAAGVRRAVLHCDGSSFPEGTPERVKAEENIKRLRPLAEYLSGTDTVICLENLRKYVRSADELLAIIDAVQSPNLGICLDTGHLNLCGGNQAEFIRKAGNRLKALHLADNEGERDQHMMPCGKGKVDFLTVFRELKKLGYDGLCNLEIPGERDCPLEVRGYKTEYLKRMFAYFEKNCD
jgi:sugar phosphate isomerase/epimerase